MLCIFLSLSPPVFRPDARGAFSAAPRQAKPPRPIFAQRSRVAGRGMKCGRFARRIGSCPPLSPNRSASAAGRDDRDENGDAGGGSIVPLHDHDPRILRRPSLLHPRRGRGRPGARQRPHRRPARPGFGPGPAGSAGRSAPRNRRPLPRVGRPCRPIPLPALRRAPALPRRRRRRHASPGRVRPPPLPVLPRDEPRARIALGELPGRSRCGAVRPRGGRVPAVSFRQTQFVFRTPLACLVVRPSGGAS